MITQQRLRKIFDYDPEGYLLWKKAKSRFIGKRAGSFKSDYAKVRVDGTSYLVHRLIFLWHRGFLPRGLDHRNREQFDNRIENLRPATQGENCRNTKLYKNNKTGFKGVFYCYVTKKYHAVIGHKNHTIFLGSFTNKSEAAKNYNIAARRFHGEFAFLNKV